MAGNQPTRNSTWNTGPPKLGTKHPENPFEEVPIDPNHKPAEISPENNRAAKPTGGIQPPQAQGPPDRGPAPLRKTKNLSRAKAAASPLVEKRKKMHAEEKFIIEKTPYPVLGSRRVLHKGELGSKCRSFPKAQMARDACPVWRSFLDERSLLHQGPLGPVGRADRFNISR